MTELFNVTFEDQKFLTPGNLGDFVVCSGGSIKVASAAALVGSYGMSVTPELTGTGNYEGLNYLAKYVGRQTRLRQRFYFDPNSISCSANTNIYMATGGYFTRPVYKLVLYWGGSYYLYTYCYRDDATYAYSGTFAISDASQYIEMDWKASSAPGANDGFLTIWVGGVEKKTSTGIDNDTLWVSTPRLGIVTGVSSGYTVSGTMYYDSWKANNDGGEIGA